MAAKSYDDILKRAQTELTQEEQQRLSEELSKNGKSNRRRSILELEGLGKEVWEGVDVDEYIARERDSWD